MTNRLVDFSLLGDRRPDPKAQWSNVRYLSYGENVALLLSQRHHKLVWCDKQNEGAEFLYERTQWHVIACARQAEEYFQAAKACTNITKPVLQYYGMLSLAKVVISLSYPDFMSDRSNLMHGLKHVRDEGSPVRRHRIEIFPTGMFSMLRKAIGMPSLSERIQLLAEEVFEHIPDVYDFMRGGSASILPCHIQQYAVRTSEETSDWLILEPVDSLTEPERDLVAPELQVVTAELRQKFRLRETVAFCLIPDPARPQEHLTFLQHRKHFATFSGKHFVPLKCRTTGGIVEFTEIELLHIAMFLLSSLARYEPQAWSHLTSGLVSSDMHFIAEFLDVAQQKHPFLCCKTLAEINEGFL